MGSIQAFSEQCSCLSAISFCGWVWRNEPHWVRDLEQIWTGWPASWSETDLGWMRFFMSRFNTDPDRMSCFITALERNRMAEQLYERIQNDCVEFSLDLFRRASADPAGSGADPVCYLGGKWSISDWNVQLPTKHVIMILLMSSSFKFKSIKNICCGFGEMSQRLIETITQLFYVRLQCPVNHVFTLMFYLLSTLLELLLKMFTKIVYTSEAKILRNWIRFYIFRDNMHRKNAWEVEPDVTLAQSVHQLIEVQLDR